MEDRQAITLQMKTKLYQEEAVSEELYEGEGEIIRKNHAIYFRYEEQHNLGADTIPVTVKLVFDTLLGQVTEVKIMRSGEMDVRIYLKKESITNSLVRAPFGVMNMETLTSSLYYKESDVSGKFMATYDLTNEGGLIGTYEVLFSFRVKETAEK